jgi:hypothetical protein
MPLTPIYVLAPVYKSFLLLRNNGYKYFYTIFKGSNVNEIISYFEHL